MEHYSPTPSPIGGRSFLDAAKVRILLAPIGDITPAEFQKWSEHVRNFETVRLKDLSSSKRPSTGTPLHSVGEVHLSFVTSYDPSHSFLAPFNLHRQVLGVLGLTTFSSSVDRDSLERAPSALRELHPGALVHRVYGFDNGASRPQTMDLSSVKDVAAKLQSADADLPSSDSDSSLSSQGGFSGRNAGGLVIFPAVRKDAKDVNFYLKTLISELVASIVDGLDGIVSSLEGTPLETPRETLDGIVPPSASQSSQSSQSSSLGAAASTAASRASALFSSFSSSSASSASTSRPSSALGGGSQPDSLTSSPKSRLGKKGKKTLSAGGTGPTGAGRFAKVKADYHLLVGDLWSALEGYDTSLTLLGKERAVAGGQDAVWYASALEGWAVAKVLVSRMGGEVLEKAPSFDLPTGGSKGGQPWVEISEAYAMALAIYSKCLAPPSVLLEPAKSVTNETPRDFTHPLIHAGACISYARFLMAVWASGGWNSECFDQLLYGGVPPALAESSRPSAGAYQRFSAHSGVQRNEIACAASSALTHSVSALKASDQLTLLSTLTSIYGCIGFSRREAYLLRRLQALIVSLLTRLICGQAQQPITSSAPLPGKAREDELVGTMIEQLSQDTTASGGPEAVLVLAMQACETYGIHVQVDPLLNVPSHHILSRAGEGLRSAYTSPNPDAPASAPVKTLLTRGELDAQPRFGWIEQQVALLKDAISVTELLGDNIGMAFFAAILLRDFSAKLAAEEQWRVLQGLIRVTAAARWQGAQDLQVRYWGPSEPLCSLQMVPVPTHRAALERTLDEVQPAEEGAPGLVNPFFWNPSKTTTTSKTVIVAADEPIEIIATLQNDLSIDLEVESVRLVTEGVAFDATPTKTTMPAKSFHTVRLSGTPRAAGTVRFTGVALKLASCAESVFTLPIFDEASSKERSARAAEEDDRRQRLKTIGLDSRVVQAEKRKSRRSELRYLSCVVAPAQPLLRIECSSLRYGTLELYEGERRTIKVHLTNTSETAVEQVKLDFTEDLSEVAKRALLEGELLASDAHELEWDLLHRPVFSPLEAGGRISIPAGSTRTLEVSVLGKLECTSGALTVTYASAAPFARQATLRLRLTVLPVFECGMLDIQPLEAASAARLTATSLCSDANDTQLVDAALSWSTDDFCLLSMDVRNVSSTSASARFSLNTGGVVPLEVERTLLPGETSRIALPCPRLWLSLSEVGRAIPSLSRRQFVVARHERSEMEMKTDRECFWYREQLLLRLSARWTSSSSRHGEVPLRDQVVQPHHLLALRKDPLSVRLSTPTPHVHAQEFVTISAQIENRSERALRLFFRLVPLEDAGMVVADGNLAEPLAPWPLDCAGNILPSSKLVGTDASPMPHRDGESRTQQAEVCKTVCFLATGVYAFIAVVEEVLEPGSSAVDRVSFVTHKPLEIVVT